MSPLSWCVTRGDRAACGVLFAWLFALFRLPSACAGALLSGVCLLAWLTLRPVGGGHVRDIPLSLSSKTRLPRTKRNGSVMEDFRERTFARTRATARRKDGVLLLRSAAELARVPGRLAMHPRRTNHQGVRQARLERARLQGTQPGILRVQARTGALPFYTPCKCASHSLTRIPPCLHSSTCGSASKATCQQTTRGRDQRSRSRTVARLHDELLCCTVVNRRAVRAGFHMRGMISRRACPQYKLFVSSHSEYETPSSLVESHKHAKYTSCPAFTHMQSSQSAVVPPLPSSLNATPSTPAWRTTGRRER